MAKDAFGNYQCTSDDSAAGSSPAVGGGASGSSGTDDPNTLTFAASVLFYEQFDTNGVPVATWARKDSSSTWYVTVQNQ